MSNDQNSIPELLELLLRVSAASGKTKEIKIAAELRISTADLDGPDGLCFAVGLKRAWLGLDLSGLEPVPESRFGEPTKKNEVPIKQTISSRSTTRKDNEGQSRGHLGVSPAMLPKAALAIEGKVALSTRANETVSTTSAETASHIRVKARGGLMWEVTDSSRLDVLDATYLENDVLCRVTATTGANAKNIVLVAYTKQRDILLHLTKNDSFLSFGSNNHEKMMRILIAKALSTSGTKFSGIITFSRSEVDVEE